jgi:hypothetical protein
MAVVAWAAIALLAATLFGSLFYLGNRIDALGARIDSFEARLDSRIDRLEARLAALDARFDVVNGRLDPRSDARVERHVD